MSAAAPAAAAVAPSAGPAIRLVLQRVNTASLLVDNNSRRVSIGGKGGIVCHVAFFAGANETTVTKAVKLVSETKMFSFENPLEQQQQQQEGVNASAPPARSKPVSLVDDRDLSLMIIPQASIGGKVKGKMIQYHGQAGKAEGIALYNGLVDGLRRALLPPAVIETLDANGEVSAAAAAASEEEPQEAKAESKAKKGSGAKEPVAGKGVVVSGTYGNVQSLQLETFGPMTHVLDVDQ